ncbi:MAG: peptide chain release factor N(5)-glutamine methyltransferase [Propionibacteriaceae bacterium]|nr:peptide chain release factor N(5)-glutamine methyltransferase [Propionibacteriaceae bacterium]
MTLTQSRLRQAGIVSASAEARTLVSFVLGVEPARLVLAPDLTPHQQNLLSASVESRMAGMPLQHVTGQAFFRTGSVRVGPGVFIPRPETEVVAGWAVDQVKAGYRRVVELCAGSGAISVAIARESDPTAQWAVEKDPEAFAYLVTNVQGSAIIPVNADMATALVELNATVDLVVANPPYIPRAWKQMMPRDVHEDPDVALYSGPDGLDALAVVADVARRLLRPRGVVGCEHGEDQAEQVRILFTQAGLSDVRTHMDLCDRPRFVTAVQPEG